MPTCPYDPLIGPWYWSVLDSSPGTQVWSTDAGAFVPLADATYAAWIAAGCAATPTDTFFGLINSIASLAANNDPIGEAPPAVFTLSANLALTNRLPKVILVQPTGPGFSVTLPVMNTPISPPLGRRFQVRNEGGFSFALKNLAGSTLATVAQGEVYSLFNVSFNTPQGAFVYDLCTNGLGGDYGLRGYQGGHSDTVKAEGSLLAWHINSTVALSKFTAIDPVAGDKLLTSTTAFTAPTYKYTVSTDVSLGGGSPSATNIPNEVAVKTYIDGLAVNLGKRARVRAATTANITIATALNNGDVLDGVTLATGDYVLVKNQTAPEQNGVYVVGVTPARATEFDTYNEHPGSLIAVEEGTANADTLWLCTSNDGGTLNTTAIAFSKMVIAGELLAANNLSDVASAQTARTNLGISTRVQGRMSLVSATPYMTTSQSAKTTLYWMPDEGNQCPVYDGTNMVPTTFTELSVATTDTAKSPAAIGASKINDWFFWNDAGTLRIGHGPDRASDTAAADVVTVNGVDINASSITNGPAAQRGTWIGTTRSNASSQIDYIFGAAGTAGWFGLCNRYNRRKVASTSAINTASWTYSTATTRESNGSSTARVSFVQCKADDVVEVMHVQRAQAPAVAGNTFYSIGFALDSTTVFDKQVLFLSGANALISVSVPAANSYTGLVGFHFVAPTEAGDGTNTYTIYAQQFQSFRVVLNL